MGFFLAGCSLCVEREMKMNHSIVHCPVPDKIDKDSCVQHHLNCNTGNIVAQGRMFIYIRNVCLFVCCGVRDGELLSERRQAEAKSCVVYGDRG